MLIKSFEMKVSCDVKLNGWDYTSDEFQENQQGKVRFNLLSIFSHGVGHAFQHVSMLAGMHCWHNQVFNEVERFHGQCLVQVLFLNIFFDFFVGNRVSREICCAKEHSGSVIIFIIDDVHSIVPEIFLVDFFLFQFW